MTLNFIIYIIKWYSLMQFNFLKSKLFLLIFMLFFYNKYIFANNLFKQKENIYLNDKKSIDVKNNIKKNQKKKNVFYFYTKIKNILKNNKLLLKMQIILDF